MFHPISPRSKRSALVKKVLVGGGILFTSLCSEAQIIYTPSMQFFDNYPGPQLYNQFQTTASNGSSGPNWTVTAHTPNSGVNFTGTLAATGPFSYSESVTNGASFGTFLGPVTATESASMSTSANYGLLSAHGSADATGSFSMAQFGNIGVSTAGQPVVEYTDKITITATGAHPDGTFAPVKFTEAFAASDFSTSGITQENYAELIGTLVVSQTTGPVLQVNDLIGESYEGPLAGGAGDPGTFLPLPTPLLPGEQYGLDSVSSTVSLEVGATYIFNAGLFAGGEASATFDTSEGQTSDENSVSVGADAYTLIDTAGLDYTTASGTTYDSQLPGNSPQGVPDGGMTCALVGFGLAFLGLLRLKVSARASV